jgi:hypothetical protein
MPRKRTLSTDTALEPPAKRPTPTASTVPAIVSVTSLAAKPATRRGRLLSWAWGCFFVCFFTQRRVLISKWDHRLDRKCFDLNHLKFWILRPGVNFCVILLIWLFDIIDIINCGYFL